MLPSYIPHLASTLTTCRLLDTDMLSFTPYLASSGSTMQWWHCTFGVTDTRPCAQCRHCTLNGAIVPSVVPILDHVPNL